MIVSRTPLRVSFFGGGTDYPEWFETHGGEVLSATIDKYCWLTVRRLPPFFAHKNRIVYRVIETTDSVSSIEHPTVRACLERFGLERMEIHHDADLPARSGMGTSSAFTVGLLHALHALEGRRVEARALAMEAIHVERNLLKETVGWQDQLAAAHGGFNRIVFEKSAWPGPATSEIERLPLPALIKDELARHLLLFFTGLARTASDVAESYVPGLARNPALVDARRLVKDGLDILCNHPSPVACSGGPCRLDDFGDLLLQGWAAKRDLSPAVSTPEIDTLFQRARSVGAIGGKLLGAGGGGFLLLYVRPNDQMAVRHAFRDVLEIPFRFENEGSKIVVYDP